MLYSFLILLREGFEIALVLAIVLGYLARTGNREHFREIWTGAIVAAAICIVAGAILELTTASLSGSTQEAFEGVTMLFAVCALTWMVFWMRRQAVSIGRDLRQQVDLALEKGSLTALMALAFSAVLREGLETTLLLFAGASASAAAHTASFLGGAFAGGLLAAVLGYLVYRGSGLIPMRRFFTISGIVVIVDSGGIGVHRSRGTAGIRRHWQSRLAPWDTDATLSYDDYAGQVPAHVDWLRLGADLGPDRPLLDVPGRRPWRLRVWRRPARGVRKDNRPVRFDAPGGALGMGRRRVKTRVRLSAVLAGSVFLLVACSTGGGREIEIIATNDGCTPAKITASTNEKLTFVMKNQASGDRGSWKAWKAPSWKRCWCLAGRTRIFNHTTPKEATTEKLKCYIPGGPSTIIDLVSSEP